MKTANTKVNGLKNDVIKKFVKQLPQYKTYLIKDPLGFVKPMVRAYVYFRPLFFLSLKRCFLQCLQYKTNKFHVIQ